MFIFFYLKYYVYNKVWKGKHTTDLVWCGECLIIFVQEREQSLNLVMLGYCLGIQHRRLGIHIHHHTRECRFIFKSQKYMFRGGHSYMLQGGDVKEKCIIGPKTKRHMCPWLELYIHQLASQCLTPPPSPSRFLPPSFDQVTYASIFRRDKCSLCLCIAR